MNKTAKKGSNQICIYFRTNLLVGHFVCLIDLDVLLHSFMAAITTSLGAIYESE
jgi:hypothetical protein